VVVPQPPDVRLLGLTGAPGVGKSTLAALLAEGWGHAIVPMDGFHLADAELVRRRLRDRKGAPDTFDAEGYAALLRRVRTARPGDADVMAPAYDRGVEQPVAGSLAVPATGPVVTEGNYLLLDEARWRAVRAEVDVVWHLRARDDSLRRERLLARHVAFGKPLDEARAWVERVDEPNARLVEDAAVRADLVVEVDWSSLRTNRGPA